MYVLISTSIIETLSLASAVCLLAPRGSGRPSGGGTSFGGSMLPSAPAGRGEIAAAAAAGAAEAAAAEKGFVEGKTEGGSGTSQWQDRRRRWTRRGARTTDTAVACDSHFTVWWYDSTWMHSG